MTNPDHGRPDFGMPDQRSTPHLRLVDGPSEYEAAEQSSGAGVLQGHFRRSTRLDDDAELPPLRRASRRPRQAGRPGSASFPLRPLRRQRVRLRRQPAARRPRGRGRHAARVREAADQPAQVRAPRGPVLGVDPPRGPERRRRPHAPAPRHPVRGSARVATTSPTTTSRCGRHR